MKKKYLMLAMALCMAVPAMGGCGSDTQSTTAAAATEDPTEGDVKSILTKAEYIAEDDDVTITIDKAKMNDESTKCTVTGTCKKKVGINVTTFDYTITFKWNDEGEWTCKNTEKNCEVSNYDYSLDIPEFKDTDYTALLKDYDETFTFDYDTYINYADVAGNLTVQSTEYEGGDDTYFDAVLEGSYETDYVTYNYTLDVSYSFDEDKEKWYVSYAYKSGTDEEYHLNDMTVEDVQKAFDNDAFNNVDALEYLEMDDEWWYKMYLCDMTVTDVLAFEIDNEEQTATATVEAEFENDADEYGTFNITLDLEMKFDTYDNEWEVSSYDSDTVKITNDNIKKKQDEEETTEAEEETTKAEEETEEAKEDNEELDKRLDALQECYDNDFSWDYTMFSLVYLDDDEYPELFVESDDSSENSYLLVYTDDVVIYELEGVFVGYMEKTGKFISATMQDENSIEVNVYSYEDGEVSLEGTAVEVDDEDGNPVSYTWNDEEMSEDELTEIMSDYFDMDNYTAVTEVYAEDFETAKSNLGL